MNSTRQPWLRAVVVCLGVVALAMSGFAWMDRASAQAAPNPFAILAITDVKPEAWDDYLALQKAETVPMMKKAGFEVRHAWRVKGPGKGFRVAYVYPIASLKTFDEAPPADRVLGVEGAKAYNAKLRKMIDGTKTLAVRTRRDLGFGTLSPFPTLGIVSHVKAIPGRTFDFEGFLKGEYGAALKKGGVPLYVVQEVILGGEMGEYYTFIPIDTIASLDGGHPVVRALGPEGYATLLGKMGNTIASVEREIMRLDTDLSYDTTAK